MTIEEARELRAALAEALDPLYAARIGTLPAGAAVERAIGRLREIDEALRRVALQKEAVTV